MLDVYLFFNLVSMAKKKLNKYSSYNGIRTDLLNLMPLDFSNSVILDVGCYRGANAKYLKDYYENVKYIGLEYDDKAIENVFDEVDEIYKVDLNKFNKNMFEKYNFDFIILGDVIEHLYYPENLLDELLQLSHENTKTIVSIPNIQFYGAILNIIFGKFPRRDRGIFDKTHFRWFTNREFKRLIDGKYEIVKFNRAYRLVDGEHFNSLNFFTKYLKPVLFLFSPFFTYQMKYILAKKS